MSDIPEDTLAMIPKLAAEGIPVGRIAFLLHLSEGTVKAELRRLGLPVSTIDTKVASAQGDQ